MSLGPLYWRATRAVTAAPSSTGRPYATGPSLAANSTWASRTWAASYAQNLADAGLHGLTMRVHDHLGIRGLLIGIGDAGEVGDLPAQGFLVKPLDVAPC